MKHTINIKGPIIPNAYKWYYDWMEMDSTAPKDIQKVIDMYQDGDEIEVMVNSPGGVISSGSEIYSLLRSKRDAVKIYVTGEACSAASIISMAGYCEMAPTALMMVHCVSTSTSGNHADMRKTADVLETADRALCQAYMEKAGMSEEEALEMMEQETWLTAEQARERGLIDGVMFEKNEPLTMVAADNFELPTDAQMEKVRNMIQISSQHIDKTALNIAKAQMRFLNLRGEER